LSDIVRRLNLPPEFAMILMPRSNAGGTAGKRCIPKRLLNTEEV